MHMNKLSTAAVTLATFAVAGMASAEVVRYDAFSDVSGFATPDPFAARVLDFIQLDGPAGQSAELDGLRVGFTVSGASESTTTPLVIFTEFFSGVDLDADDPLAGATSLGTQGINFGEQDVDRGTGGGIPTGLSANSNDIILPFGETIGVQIRFRQDGSTFSEIASARLIDVPADGVGSVVGDSYYLDADLDGFSAADAVARNGKTFRLEVSTLPVPEPTSVAVLGGLGLLGLRRRR